MWISTFSSNLTCLFCKIAHFTDCGLKQWHATFIFWCNYGLHIFSAVDILWEYCHFWSDVAWLTLDTAMSYPYSLGYRCVCVCRIWWKARAAGCTHAMHTAHGQKRKNWSKKTRGDAVAVANAGSFTTELREQATPSKANPQPRSFWRALSCF